MNEAIISLGANTPDAAAALTAALDFVGLLGSVAVASGTFRSEAEGRADAPAYLNNILILATSLSLDNLARSTKEYESGVRHRAAAEPLVAIDIDIVSFNGTILRPEVVASRYYSKGIATLQCGCHVSIQ